MLGKGGKYRPLFFSLKTAQAIEAYRKTLPDTSADRPVWMGERGPLRKTGVYQIFKRIAKKSGIKDICLCHPHAWRHRWARTMDDNGMTTPKLQFLMGHASPETTNIYTKPDDAEIQAEYDRYADFD